MSTRTDDPGHLLKELNARFNKMISSQQYMFATAFCAILDHSNQTLQYANAGHPHPFLVQRRRNICEPIGNQSIGKGLGLLPDSTYQTVHCPFDPSDGLFLYTDGAYELQNSDGEEFTPQGLQNVITQQMSQPAPSSSKASLTQPINSVTEDRKTTILRLSPLMDVHRGGNPGNVGAGGRRIDNRQKHRCVQLILECCKVIVVTEGYGLEIGKCAIF